MKHLPSRLRGPPLDSQDSLLSSIPAELIQGKGCALPHAPFRKPLFLTCFHAPSRIRESLVLGDLVFQDFNLLYFEIEIPEPARDLTLTADLLNSHRLQQLRKSIYPPHALQRTIRQEAQDQGCISEHGSCVHPRPPPAPTSREKMAFTCTPISKYQDGEIPHKTPHACLRF